MGEYSVAAGWFENGVVCCVQRITHLKALQNNKEEEVDGNNEYADSGDGFSASDLLRTAMASHMWLMLWGAQVQEALQKRDKAMEGFSALLAHVLSIIGGDETTTQPPTNVSFKEEQLSTEALAWQMKVEALLGKASCCLGQQNSDEKALLNAKSLLQYCLSLAQQAKPARVKLITTRLDALDKALEKLANAKKPPKSPNSPHYQKQITSTGTPSPPNSPPPTHPQTTFTSPSDNSDIVMSPSYVNAMNVKSSSPSSSPPPPSHSSQPSSLGIIHWMPDDAVTSCCVCSTPFTLFNRRHHCRFDF